MQRYDLYSEVIKNIDGKRRYATLYYPEITKRQSDIYIITKKFDRLDLLASKYYNDPRFWVMIAKANNLHQASLFMPAGMRLRIPASLEYNVLGTEFKNKQL